jgi:hypothetical protein
LLMFPAVALLLGRLLPAVGRTGDRTVLFPAAVLVALGAGLIAAGAGLARPGAAAWLAEAGSAVPRHAGAALIAAGVAMAAACRLDLESRVRLLATVTAVGVVVLSWGFLRASGPAYDVRAACAFLARLEAQGATLAVAASYFGQFHFYGRLRSRIEPIAKSGAEQWAAQHPDGYLIAYYEPKRWPPEGKPAFRALYRGGGMAVWPAREILAHPEITAAFK